MTFEETKNIFDYQHVAPSGYHFVRNGENLGRVIWTNNVEGIMIVKDE